MKPQTYSGEDDFEDFLTQFEITSEINKWSYNEKSLYLANSLTGGARSLLTEMNERERRDFSGLVEKLKARYGHEHKAEVFRAQLKTRIRQRNESVPELAHAIRKMTRQAYPSASTDVIEALSLDNFIDALNDPDIRLRLREVAPKTLSEAEIIAVRMEAPRVADRQRSQVHVVGNVDERVDCKTNNIREHRPSLHNTNNIHSTHNINQSNTNTWKHKKHEGRARNENYNHFHQNDRVNNNAGFHNRNNGYDKNNKPNFTRNGQQMVDSRRNWSGKSNYRQNTNTNKK